MRAERGSLRVTSLDRRASERIGAEGEVVACGRSKEKVDCVKYVGR